MFGGRVGERFVGLGVWMEKLSGLWFRVVSVFCGFSRK